MVAIRLSMIALLVLSVAPVRAEPIRIAYSGVSASGTPVWLAKDEGIFAKHGLEADLVADRSGDAGQRMINRTAHADALHQAGRRAEAEVRFHEAEALQAERQSNYPLLYSVLGFQ